MGPDNNYGIDCAKGLAEDIRVFSLYRLLDVNTFLYYLHYLYRKYKYFF